MERGRPQRPLDESSGPVRDLAAALRELRASAGNPPYRTMATTAHFSPATLARAAAGHRLPSRDVVIAYAVACGADAADWEERWRACADQMTQPRIDAPPAGPPADGMGGHESPNQPVPPVAYPSRSRRPRARLRATTSSAIPIAAVALLLGIAAASDMPARGAPSGVSAEPPGATAAHPLGRACDPNGVIAPMPTGAGSPSAGSRRIRASFEPGFDTNRDGWAWWWPDTYRPLPGDFTTDHASDGTRSLRLRVAPGVSAAVGTIHLDGLKPGGTVTVHIWYGGQGEGNICPFVQTPQGGAIEWVRQADLELTTSDWSQWYTYSWRVPDSKVLGTGIQLDNAGAVPFVVLLDAVTW